MKVLVSAISYVIGCLYFAAIVAASWISFGGSFDINYD